MEEGRNVYSVLVGRLERKRPLGRPRRRWKDNIKLDFREIGIDGVNWIRLAQDRVQLRAFVNKVMNLKKGYYLTRRATINFSKNNLHHGVSSLVSQSVSQSVS
jgi:hypothetical protein